MTTYVRRPWVDHFGFLAYTNEQLVQQNKLIRNQLVSLDLGSPSARFYDSHHARVGNSYCAEPREKPDTRTLYLEWVADWKRTYKQLSETIRALKQQRKFKGTLAVEDRLKQLNKSWSNLSSGELFDKNSYRVREALDSLKIAAQVMLSARYNAKLAAAELRRRRLEQTAA